jgi:hypothetical protein
MMGRMMEYDVATCHLFVDFKTAYDSTTGKKLYETMQELGFPKKLISLTSFTRDKSVCAIKLGNSISRLFITQKGLRRGDALACCLFSTALEKTVRDANVWTRGIMYNK